MTGGFGVVIPMYNEERGAEKCVRSVCAALAAIPSRNKLLVVNDGSGDRTGEILDRLAPEFPNLSVFHHERNLGYGGALRTGTRKAIEAGYDYALFMDSDLTNDPADIVKFVVQMDKGCDVIKASRYTAGGGMPGVPWKRRVISQAGNAVARILFGTGLRDCTNGFRAVRTSILARTNLQENGFPIIVEELYQCKFLARTFCEIPVLLTNRSEEQRPTSFSYKPETLRKYLSFAIKAFLGVKPKLKEESLQ
jgi:dolichol-phosphate mannosyltransferase